MTGELIKRVSDCELEVRRIFNATSATLFHAWTKPDLMMRWWVPKSFGITVLSAEMDARVGGSYRFVFAHPAFDAPMAFFGRYLEAEPDERLKWTNDESADGAVTSVTFTEAEGRTEVVLRDLYPSKEALDAAFESGSISAYDEQFAQLDAVLSTLG